MIYITVNNAGKLSTFRSIKAMKKESPPDIKYYHTPLGTISVLLIKLDGYTNIYELFDDMGLTPKLVSEATYD